MKRGFHYILIAMLSVLALVFCILYITNNQDKNRKIEMLSADAELQVQNMKELDSRLSLRDSELQSLKADLEDRETRIQALENETVQ